MFSDGVVERLDVFEEASSNLLSGFVTFVMNQFFLQASKERLHGRVVVAVSFPRHAACESILFEQPLVLLARILAATV